MKKQITICVTAKDIKSGRAFQYTKCPIALAASRHTGGKVRVGSQFITLGKQQLKLPPKALQFMRYFDNWGRSFVEPFKFHLRVNR